MFERTGALDVPPSMLLTTLNVVGARHERKGHCIAGSVNGDGQSESETTN
jgi:hypothetical protein